MAAVLEFLKEGGNQDFQQDLSREAMVMTFNPGGWLRRK
jgi:cephalosporin hydroxylase